MTRRLKLDNYVVAQAPRLGVRGWARWSWRQVTSMRAALLLLLLLGLASIPGSAIPQLPQNPLAARQFVVDNGAWGRLLERLGFLDVFGSAWFTAIYLVLFASLIGCIIPRTISHARTLAAPVAPAPRNLERFDIRAESSVADASADEVVLRARAALRRRGGWAGGWTRVFGYRVRVDKRGAGGSTEWALAGEQTAVYETANLIFHMALVGVLSSLAVSGFMSYRGQAVIVEGESFANALADYDSFGSGNGFDPATLVPFTLRLDSFESSFTDGGRPLDFTAAVTATEPRSEPTPAMIKVNSPLTVAGSRIYLQGNGYAPHVTVRDADGVVAFSASVPFLPQDGVYTSTGVIKVPDVSTGDQIGIRATLLPTALVQGTSAISVSPEPGNPLIVMVAFTGNLGLDDGIPRSVYALDTTEMDPVVGADGAPAVLLLTPGTTVALPSGLGTVTWDSLPRFVAVDIRRDPAAPWLLACALLTALALTVTLFAPRRRAWVVARTGAATTVVTAAAHGPSHDEGLAAVLDRLLRAATSKESGWSLGN